MPNRDPLSVPASDEQIREWESLYARSMPVPEWLATPRLLARVRAQEEQIARLRAERDDARKAFDDLAAKKDAEPHPQTAWDYTRAKLVEALHRATVAEKDRDAARAERDALAKAIAPHVADIERMRYTLAHGVADGERVIVDGNGMLARINDAKIRLADAALAALGKAGG